MRPRIIRIRSSGLFFVAAATTPMVMLQTIHTRAAPKTSERVIGVASMTSGMTCCPRFWNEVRSRVMNSRFIISRYWMGNGRSRPKSWRTAASTSGEALRPAMRAAGSAPGVTKKMRKTTTLIPTMTKTIWNSRRITTLSIGLPDPQLGAGIQRVAHPITQHVESKHAEHDGDTRRQRHPRPRIKDVLAILDDRAPARVGRLHADGQKRKCGFGQHVEGQHQRHEDDQRRHDIGQDIAKQDAIARHAEPDGSEHILAFLQR